VWLYSVDSTASASEVDTEVDTGATFGGAWVAYMNASLAGLTAAMGYVPPSYVHSGFSRMREVEEQIKARQAADKSSE
jgi:hypothetical protein